MPSLGEATVSTPSRPVHREFSGVPQQVEVARDFVCRHLPRTCPPDAVAEIAVCVSEVATNAVLHTRSGVDGRFSVVVRVAPPVVRVDVFDGGPAAEPRGRVDELDEGGRGLLIVRALARRSGYEVSRSGGLSWFEYVWVDGAVS